MDMERNNIVLTHKGVKISIAQHFNHKGVPWCQEATVIGGEKDFLTHTFNGNLTSFLQALVLIKNELGE
tara:strand:- start:598 stop:804 length:207 start_codon:yes stop_codon:yes gene_type:complete